MRSKTANLYIGKAFYERNHDTMGTMQTLMMYVTYKVDAENVKDV